MVERRVQTLALLTVLVCAAGCSRGAAGIPVKGAPAVHDVTVELVLSDLFTWGNECVPLPSGGYTDIDKGARVTIYDSGNKVVATGELGDGTPTPNNQGAGPYDCTYLSKIKEVPGGLDFYSVEITHRGKVTYSEQELIAGPSVTLGD